MIRAVRRDHRFMTMRRVAPATALFLLSPLVAEYLLGDFTLAQLTGLVLLAPAYGGAAVLIRELARRAGRGGPTIVLLALAYGLIEEGLETQSLFNPGYLNAHLLDRGFVPALGIAVPWTLFVLTLHTVWSISVPIALIEEGTDRRTEPWLRTPGLVVVSLLAALGAAATFVVSYLNGHFMASPGQLAATVVIAAGLIVLAFRLPRREPTPVAVPSPWLVAAVTLVAGALFVAGFRLPAAAGAPLLAVVLAGMAILLLRWSARAGWDGRHRVAAAGGALLTYAWHSFVMHPVVPASTVMIVVSHLVFALGAVALLVVLALRLRRAERLAPADAVSTGAENAPAGRARG
jgi:hypothetical protein